jgi:hypothetical protein
MLGSSRVAAQLAATREALGSMNEREFKLKYVVSFIDVFRLLEQMPNTSRFLMELHKVLVSIAQVLLHRCR